MPNIRLHKGVAPVGGFSLSPRAAVAAARKRVPPFIITDLILGAHIPVRRRNSLWLHRLCSLPYGRFARRKVPVPARMVFLFRLFLRRKDVICVSSRPAAGMQFFPEPSCRRFSGAGFGGSFSGGGFGLRFPVPVSECRFGRGTVLFVGSCGLQERFGGWIPSGSPVRCFPGREDRFVSESRKSGDANTPDGGPNGPLPDCRGIRYRHSAPESRSVRRAAMSVARKPACAASSSSRLP